MPRFKCLKCGKGYRKSSRLHSHLKKNHQEEPRCRQSHLLQKALKILQQQSFNSEESEEDSEISEFTEIEAFRGFLRSFRHRLPENLAVKSVEGYFEKFKNEILHVFKYIFKEVGSFELQLSVVCEFIRCEQKSDSSENTDYSSVSETDSFEKSADEICVHYINGFMSIVFSKHFILDAIAENESTIAHLVNIFESNGSNWKLNRVLGSDLRVAEYDPFKGS